MFMRSDDGARASFKTVDLSNARITGQLDLTGASLDGDLNADFVQVGGSLFMPSDDNNTTSVGKVNLSGANVAGGTSMDRAVLRDSLVAQGLRVAGDVSIRDIACGCAPCYAFCSTRWQFGHRRQPISPASICTAHLSLGEMRLGNGNRLIGWRALTRSEPGRHRPPERSCRQFVGQQILLAQTVCISTGSRSRILAALRADSGC